MTNQTTCKHTFRALHEDAEPDCLHCDITLTEYLADLEGLINTIRDIHNNPDLDEVDRDIAVGELIKK